MDDPNTTGPLDGQDTPQVPAQDPNAGQGQGVPPVDQPVPDADQELPPPPPVAEDTNTGGGQTVA